jgi:hypothetical protein
MTFRRLSAAELNGVPNHRHFEILAKHIAKQVESEFSLRVSRLRAIPASAQTVYWVWRFSCEAEGGGIEVFILQADELTVRSVHEALRSIEDTELLSYLEAAIALAMKWHPEFARDGNTEWFRQFRSRLGFKTLHDIDDQIWPKGYKRLRKRILAFIHKNLHSLVKL